MAGNSKGAGAKASPLIGPGTRPRHRRVNRTIKVRAGTPNRNPPGTYEAEPEDAGSLA